MLNSVDRGAILPRGPVLGFLGTERYAAIASGDTQIFYVDPAHANASDQNDGTDPTAPMASLQGLINRTLATNGGTSTRRPIVQSFDTIFVMGDITEAVTILNNSLIGSFVNLIGIGLTQRGPLWRSGAAASPCLVAGGIGWVISGFRFAPHTAAAGIVVPNTSAPYGANAVGTGTVIEGNIFDGAVEVGGGLIGVDLHGAPAEVVIRGNQFKDLANIGATAAAILATNVATADPAHAVIEGNHFVGCNLFIDASLDESLVKDNVFAYSAVVASITVDLRAGGVGLNTVTGNDFGQADYSNVGGFWANAGAPGSWVGNTSADIAEAEVGDNGLTVLPPA